MSDYEKYIIFLPDRTNANWTPFGEVDENNVGYYFEDDMLENLRIALIPDYKSELYDTDASSQEFRTKID